MMSTDKTATSGLAAYSMPASGAAPKPVYRRLRGYAFDPSLSAQLDTAVMEAVRQWQYLPKTLNGAPTASLLNLTVEFAIAGR